jgi:hypothetical protein
MPRQETSIATFRTTFASPTSTGIRESRAHARMPRNNRAIPMCEPSSVKLLYVTLSYGTKSTEKLPKFTCRGRHAVEDSSPPRRACPFGKLRAGSERQQTGRASPPPDVSGRTSSVMAGGFWVFWVDTTGKRRPSAFPSPGRKVQKPRFCQRQPRIPAPQRVKPAFFRGAGPDYQNTRMPPKAEPAFWVFRAKTPL